MTTDVLKWWAAHESVFPRLSRMARQYLGCPTTSASAERLFSIAGRAYDDMRQGMDDEILEMLMWARVNRETRQKVSAKTVPWNSKLPSPCTPASSISGQSSSSTGRGRGKAVAVTEL